MKKKTPLNQLKDKLLETFKYNPELYEIIDSMLDVEKEFAEDAFNAGMLRAECKDFDEYWLNFEE